MSIVDDLLTADQLHKLTKRERFKAQVAALQSIGLRPIIGPDGAPIITATAVHLAMSGVSIQNVPTVSETVVAACGKSAQPD